MVVIFTSFSLAYVRSVMHYYFYSLSHYFPVVDTVFFFFFFLCFFYCFLYLFFFFFQAEDGIRDKLVTGVQTCALPIYSRCRRAVPPAGRCRCGFARPTRPDSWQVHASSGGCQVSPLCSRKALFPGRFERSEERRVGKECRSRWSRYHEKKKRTTQKIGI